MLGGDCPSSECIALTGKITKHIPCSCRRGKGLACVIAKPEDNRYRPEATPGKLLSAQRKPELGAGRQEEALACALPRREQLEDLCFFHLLVQQRTCFVTRCDQLHP